MSLTKRRISRRAMGVVVGASLLVLGLEAPVFAATTVTAVSPGSGPTDCVVVITGSGFTDFPQAQQDLWFVGPAAGAGDDVMVAQANWFAVSATEIWAAVPALVPGTTYTVTVEDPSGLNTTGGTFLSTLGAGACAPAIASFVPTCGPAGTVVTITGTNLLGPDLTAGEVRFSPYATAAAITQPDVSEPTSVSVIVPSDAADGPIRITTFSTAGGTVFSPTNFEVPPPDCLQPTPIKHARSISLSLRKHLVARGTVSAEEDIVECVAGVPVKIQRRKKGGGWKNVGSTTTNDNGNYKRRIKDRPGKYRAVAPAVTLADDSVCSKAVSPRVRHRH
jgi:hypothetical protein